MSDKWAAQRGHHDKCRSCPLSLLCVTGVITNEYIQPARLCHCCRGVWVPKLQAQVVCKLFPHGHVSKGEKCPYCLVGRGFYVHGVTVWDIPTSAELIRGFYKKRKLYRQENRRLREAGITERIRHAR